MKFERYRSFPELEDYENQLRKLKWCEVVHENTHREALLEDPVNIGILSTKLGFDSSDKLLERLHLVLEIDWYHNARPKLESNKKNEFRVWNDTEQLLLDRKLLSVKETTLVYDFLFSCKRNFKKEHPGVSEKDLKQMISALDKVSGEEECIRTLALFTWKLNSPLDYFKKTYEPSSSDYDKIGEVVIQLLSGVYVEHLI